MDIDIITYHGSDKNVPRLVAKAAIGVGNIFGSGIYTTNRLDRAWGFSYSNNSPKWAQAYQIGDNAPVETELYQRYILHKFGMDNPETLGRLSHVYSNENMILNTILSDLPEKKDAPALKEWLNEHLKQYDVDVETPKAKEIIDFYANKEIRHSKIKNPNQPIVYKLRVKGNFVDSASTLKDNGFYADADTQKICKIQKITAPDVDKKAFVKEVAQYTKSELLTKRLDIYERQEEINAFRAEQKMAANDFLFADENYQAPVKKESPSKALDSLVKEAETHLKETFLNTKCASLEESYPAFLKECKIDGYEVKFTPGEFEVPESYFIAKNENAVEIIEYATADTNWQFKPRQGVHFDTPIPTENHLSFHGQEAPVDLDVFYRKQFAVQQLTLNEKFHVDLQKRTVDLMTQNNAPHDLKFKAFLEEKITQEPALFGQTINNSTRLGKSAFDGGDSNFAFLEADSQGRITCLKFEDALVCDRYFAAGGLNEKFIVDLKTNEVFSPFETYQSQARLIEENLKGKKLSVQKDKYGYALYADDTAVLKTSPNGLVDSFNFDKKFVDNRLFVANDYYIIDLENKTVSSGLGGHGKYTVGQALESEFAGKTLAVRQEAGGYRLFADNEAVLSTDANGHIQEQRFRSGKVKISAYEIDLTTGAVAGDDSFAAALSTELKGSKMQVLKNQNGYSLYSNDRLVLKTNEHFHINELYLEKPLQIGDYFNLPKLEKIHLKNVRQVGDGFLEASPVLKEMQLPRLERVGHDFCKNSYRLQKCELPQLKSIQTNFLSKAYALDYLYAPLLNVDLNYPDQYLPLKMAKNRDTLLLNKHLRKMPKGAVLSGVEQAAALRPYVAVGEAVKAGEAVRAGKMLNSLSRVGKGVAVGVEVAGKAALPLMIADGHFNTNLMQGNFIAAAEGLAEGAVMLVSGAGDVIAHPIDSVNRFYHFAKEGENWKEVGSALAGGARMTAQSLHITTRNMLGLKSYDETEGKSLYQALGTVRKPVVDLQTGNVKTQDGGVVQEDAFYRLSLNGAEINVYCQGKAADVDSLEEKLVMDVSRQRVLSKTKQNEIVENGKTIARVEETSYYDAQALNTLETEYGTDIKGCNPYMGAVCKEVVQTTFIGALAQDFQTTQAPDGSYVLQCKRPVNQTITKQPFYAKGVLQKTNNVIETNYEAQSFALSAQELAVSEKLVRQLKNGEKTHLEVQTELNKLIEEKEPIPSEQHRICETAHTCDYYSKRYQAAAKQKVFSAPKMLNQYGIYRSKSEDYTHNKLAFYDEQGQLKAAAAYVNDDGKARFAYGVAYQEGKPCLFDKNGLYDAATGNPISENAQPIETISAGDSKIPIGYFEKAVPGYESVKYNYTEEPTEWVQRSNILSGKEQEAVLVHTAGENGVKVEKLLKIDKNTGFIKEFDSTGRFARMLMPGSSDYAQMAQLASVVTDVPNFTADEATKKKALAQNKIESLQDVILSAAQETVAQNMAEAVLGTLKSTLAGRQENSDVSTRATCQIDDEPQEQGNILAARQMQR